MAPPADQSAIDRDQAEVLHDEIDRLPGAFRTPVVLCYFEGLTARRGGPTTCDVPRAHSAAGWPGRETSSDAGSPDAASSCPPPLWPRSSTPGPPAASVSSPLCDLTTRAAIHFAAGQAAVHRQRPLPGRY